MEQIDSFLNKITMYKLTLYYLLFLIGVAMVLSFFKLLPFTSSDIIVASLIAIGVGYLANLLFARIFKAVTNIESVFITACILLLIVPLKLPDNLLFIIVASTLAMASKYLLTIEKRHIFNPAAVSVAAISLISPSHAATWWIGTPVMFPFVLIGGLLLLRKIQREDMVFKFFIAYIIVITISTIAISQTLPSVINAWRVSIFNTALFFFMLVMFTEPITSPSRKKLRSYFAYFVAILYATPQLSFLSIGLQPEIALCIGNIFFYVINPNYRFNLSLKSKQQLSNDTYAFAFNKQNDFNFIPGQYMEWTLPHKNADSRGVRRYFSISSSPTEEDLMMTVKFYEPSSSFKKKLIGFQSGSKITASQVAGDFTLPQNLKTPLVFIAGGVGIAPFRSMIQFLLDKNLSTDIILIYTNRTVNDILYADIFEKAVKNGVKTIYNLTDAQNVPVGWRGPTGYITPEKIQQLIPDYKQRIYYLSGPQLMVQNFESTLHQTGIPKSQIITDFFPGYEETK